MDEDLLQGVVHNVDRYISLALIQIHEHSLNAAGKGKGVGKKPQTREEKGSARKLLGTHQQWSRSAKDRESDKNFIFAHSEWVKADTLQGVIYNQDTDISMALQQIHTKSLASRSNKGCNFSAPPITSRFEKGSFADIVRKNTDLVVQNVKPKARVPDQSDWLESKKLFFTNLAEDVLLKEVWKTLKQHGLISDIIVPKKKD